MKIGHAGWKECKCAVYPVDNFQAQITKQRKILPIVAIFEVNLQNTSAHFEKY